MSMLKSELRQRSEIARENIKQTCISLFKDELKASMIETADSGKDNGKYLMREHKYVELIDLLHRTKKGKVDYLDYIDWLLSHVRKDYGFKGIKFSINRLQTFDSVEFSWADDSDLLM